MAETEGAKGRQETIELSRARQTAARRVAESKATIPHLYVRSEARPDSSIAELEPALARAAALALREHPDLNGSYRDGRLERYSRINIGIAIVADDAVLHPTIFDADRKRVGEIADELALLAARVDGGEITQPELSGATFTLSALGGPAAISVLPTVMPGQAAALSAGAVSERPAVIEGEVVAARVVDLVVACDQRLAGAEVAGALLSGIGARLADASAL